MCLTVYEFSFILLIHHIILLILIFVLSVTFWTLTYYEIWILLIIYCFIWNYWIIYFVTCLFHPWCPGVKTRCLFCIVIKSYRRKRGWRGVASVAKRSWVSTGSTWSLWLGWQDILGWHSYDGRGPFYSHGLTSTLAWIRNYIYYNVWYEITYPFPNFNGCTVEIWEWLSNFIPHFIGRLITYPWWDLS